MESVPDILLAAVNEAIATGEEGDATKRFASDLIAFLWDEELQAADEQIRTYLGHPASHRLSAHETAMLVHAHAAISARRGAAERVDTASSRRRQEVRLAAYRASQRMHAALQERLSLGIVIGVLVFAVDVAAAAALFIVTMDLITWLLTTRR